MTPINQSRSDSIQYITEYCTRERSLSSLHQQKMCAMQQNFTLDILGTPPIFHDHLLTRHTWPIKVHNVSTMRYVRDGVTKYLHMYTPIWSDLICINYQILSVRTRQREDQTALDDPVQGDSGHNSNALIIIVDTSYLSSEYQTQKTSNLFGKILVLV